MSLSDVRRGTAYDVVFVGGGLANGLAAYRLASRRPELRLLVLEAEEALGGNHTWSFHDGDLTPREHDWLAPFVVHRWPSYDVRFPARARPVATGYASVTSGRFADLLARRLGPAIRAKAEVVSLSPESVTLKGGETVAARAVVDGRGPAPSRHLTLGFQKFLGQEIELEAPHGLTVPVVMDATVTQDDGYRFVYLLPFGPNRLLVEDTYYADGPDLDAARLRTSIAAYVASRGWVIGRVLREENGVLPIALGGDIQGFWDEKRGVPATGLAAALFHPTTGYSLPDAVRLADAMAVLPDLSSAPLFAALRDHSVAAWRSRGFFRFLNRLLFQAGDPRRRYEILQHFYRLPDPLVARFYAGRLTVSDRVRIFAGKPPVSVLGALRVVASPSHAAPSRAGAPHAGGGHA